jgi:hypothetical protein
MLIITNTLALHSELKITFQKVLQPPIPPGNFLKGFQIAKLKV